jgi:hypothetical protein
VARGAVRESAGHLRLVDVPDEWEREWRHVGDLDFSVADPAFLIIPESHHEAARDFFHSAKTENIGPSYECPFIDPYWGEDQIAATLYG